MQMRILRVRTYFLGQRNDTLVRQSLCCRYWTQTPVIVVRNHMRFQTYKCLDVAIYISVGAEDRANTLQH